MTNAPKDLAGWRFFIPEPRDRPRVYRSWLVGIPDMFDAYRLLVKGAVSMPAEPPAIPISSSEASELKLMPGEVRQESQA